MLRLLRIPNLLIVAVTQFLLQYLVLIPALEQAHLLPSLPLIQFSLLVFTTILIAGGGYVINDIIDQHTDFINKPERAIVGRKIPLTTASQLYWSINILGAFIAIYLSCFVEQIYLFSIYPAAVLLLYVYSKYLKQTALLGNLVVAFFCAGVAGIVLFSERVAFQEIMDKLPVLYQKIKWVFTGYIVFAFLTTMVREIIKDLEDIEGDQDSGLQTLPIQYGIPLAKRLALGIMTLLNILLVIGFYWLYINESNISWIFCLFGLIIPCIYLFISITKAIEKIHFSKLSRLIKLIMLSGLLLIIILWKS